MINAIWRTLQPLLPILIALALVVFVVASPLPGRGPRSSKRHEWRSFKFENRKAVMDRAGERCEAAFFLVWGRCSNAATEADDVYPWSKGGPTTPGNGQALCQRHNRSKSNVTPPWWYVLGLERRRASYFPAGIDVRVSARA
jgi:hypothetical protein